MAFKRIKINEIAKGADVSLSTVSRYLNGKNVRSSSAARIEKYLKQTEHSDPSVVSHGESAPTDGRSIGLIISSVSSFYFSNTLAGIFAAANEYNYSVVIGTTQRDFDNERRLLIQFADKKLAGLIYVPLASMTKQVPDEIEAFKDVPIVVATRRHLLPGQIHVYADNIGGGYLATRHLLSRGRKHIGITLGTWDTNLLKIDNLFELAQDYDTLGGVWSVDRFRGYLMALKEYDIPYSPSLVSISNWSSEEGVRSAAELIGKAPHMDGLITSSDLLSAAALSTLQKHGYNVPQDISIIGWGNTELANYTTPALTSIVTPDFEIGFSAVSAINRKIRGEQVKDIELSTSIVVRNSTAIKT